MMHFFFLVALPLFAAKPECVLYQFEGKVKALAGKYVLTTQEGTRSERTFEFGHKDIPKLAPYEGKSAEGEFVLPHENPVSQTKVISLTKIDFGAPDPLQVAKGLQKLGKTPCPNE